MTERSYAGQDLAEGDVCLGKRRLFDVEHVEKLFAPDAHSLDGRLHSSFELWRERYILTQSCREVVPSSAAKFTANRSPYTAS